MNPFGVAKDNLLQPKRRSFARRKATFCKAVGKTLAFNYLCTYQKIMFTSTTDMPSRHPESFYS